VRDIALDTTTHDLLLSNLDLSLVDTIDRVAQQLKIRLWFFFTEWFLDTGYGVRFFEDILVKNPNLPRVETLLKEAIKGTPDVNRILEFQLNYTPLGRSVALTFMVDTTFGPLLMPGISLGV
jgi:hypothetical protein